MTRNRKVGLWVGLVLFAVPEILWSPIGNFWYSFFHGGDITLRPALLPLSSNLYMWVAIIFLESFGALVLSVLLFKGRVKLLTLVSVLLGLLGCVGILTCLILLSFTRISLP